MKRISRAAIAVLSLVASSALAAPVEYTIPATNMNNGNVASGTFTFDQTNSTLSAIHITTTGTNAATFNVSCNTIVDSSGEYACGQAEAVASMGTLVFLIEVTNLPNTIDRMYIGDCNVVVAGLCTEIDIFSSIQAPVVLDGAPEPAAPAAIPTLSEWAMIIMASGMAWFAFGRLRRRG